MHYEWKFFICNSEGVFGYTLYILYICAKRLFSPCGRIFLFFCLDTKEKETKRKNQGYVSGPTPERPFWLWKMNSLRCTALRQHFSEPPVHSYAHAPTPRPILFLRQGASLLALFFWMLFYALPFSYRVFLDLSHREICYFTRNSLYLGWVYIYLI